MDEIKQYKEVLKKIFVPKYEYIDSLIVDKPYGDNHYLIRVKCNIVYDKLTHLYNERSLMKELTSIFEMMGYGEHWFVVVNFRYILCH